MQTNRLIALNLAACAALLYLALPSAAWAQTRTISVEAGPIWSQSDAEQKCPQVAKENRGTWNGQWRTTVPGRMSVCEIRLSPSKEIKVVESIEEMGGSGCTKMISDAFGSMLCTLFSIRYSRQSSIARFSEIPA